jgi:hypothetical protein
MYPIARTILGAVVPAPRAATMFMAAAVAWILTACAPEPMAGVGVSPPRPVERSPAPRASSASTEWLPAALGSGMQRVGLQFLSEGHAERFDATVWANATARDHLDAGAPWPEGATFAERVTARGSPANGSDLGWLFMIRGNAGWTFGLVAPDGDDAGVAIVAACEECHREADDGVFRWRATDGGR